LQHGIENAAATPRFLFDRALAGEFESDAQWACRGRSLDMRLRSISFDKSMTTFVGIDGIPGGWVAVYLNSDGGQRFAYAKAVGRLLADPYDRAMIDMPIGLPERGYRQCDIEARALVGSRVFLGARWGLWNFKTLDEANLHYWNEEGIGRGISMQLFCIREKLQELNEVPVPPRVFESHPELFFWRIGGRVLASKTTAKGRTERTEIIEGNGIGSIKRWLGQRHGTGIGRDDLIDACACALAARDSVHRLPIDGSLARAEIWY
jgi:predicted RNase H-like nuclease